LDFSIVVRNRPICLYNLLLQIRNPPLFFTKV
jgi:hypothetical protein